MSKICKQNALLCLTCSLGMAPCDINRKQNHVCCFQTVNLSFSSRKRPTFASKVARFLSANSRLIVWIKRNVLSSKDKTLVLLFSFNQRYKSTMQMCRRICAPPEINIRIFNPLSSFLLFNDSMMQINLWKKSECISDSQILIFYAVG